MLETCSALSIGLLIIIAGPCPEIDQELGLQRPMIKIGNGLLAMSLVQIPLIGCLTSAKEGSKSTIVGKT